MTTSTSAPGRRIADEVTSWPGVKAAPGSRGEFAFTVGRRQIGHLHGDRVAHFGFPPQVGAQLREEGRVGPHPVAPDKPAWAARAIRSDDDVQEIIALLRLNYDRIAGRPLPGLVALAPHRLPFGDRLDIRAFLLERPAGNLLIYSAPALDGDERAVGVERWYLNHWHEAMFPAHLGAPLYVHQDDRSQTEERMHVRASFGRRHMLGDDFEIIPVPGHTPGATAFLWDNGAHRMLFTGDTLYLHDDEWATAVLNSSDRAAYADSLRLIRELDFDVLVPWAAQAGRPPYAFTDPADRARRIDAVLDRLVEET